MEIESTLQRVLVVDQAVIKTAFGHDGVGRLTAVTNAFGVTGQQVYTQYQYDEAGNEIAQTDALSRTTTFVYDALGRRITPTLPAGGTPEGFCYDLVGNVLYHTDFNGKIITNRYDALNRMLARVYPDGTSNTFTFTATGRRQTMQDSSSSYTNQYDLRDRLLTNTTPIAALRYTYDANGNVTSINSSSGGTAVTYQYDPLNRLTNVVDANLSGAQNTPYSYDGAGNPLRTQYPNTATNLFQYDPLNRLANLVWMTGASSDGSFYYQLGPSRNRTNLNETISGAGRGYAW